MGQALRRAVLGRAFRRQAPFGHDAAEQARGQCGSKGAGQRRRDTTGPQPTRDGDLAMLTGLASAPPPIPGALQDDPLTSPSFSLKAVPASDSRSYSNARKHAKTAPVADHRAATGVAPANGN